MSNDCQLFLKFVRKTYLMFVLLLSLALSGRKECGRCMRFLKGEKELEDSPIIQKLLSLQKPGMRPIDVCRVAGYCRTPKKHIKVEPQTNGAPVFQTETSPTWSVSWEEPI